MFSYVVDLSRVGMVDTSPFFTLSSFKREAASAHPLGPGGHSRHPRLIFPGVLLFKVALAHPGLTTRRVGYFWKIGVTNMAGSGHKSIYRIKPAHRNKRGWMVCVHFRGKKHRKFFNDKWHESKEDSLRAAIEYRDHIERELGKPRSEGKVSAKVDVRSKSGVRGVYRSRQKTGKVKPSGEPIYTEAYIVRWRNKDGKAEVRNFSIDKYGEDEAFFLACDWRRYQERQRYGHEIGVPPEPESDEGREHPPVVIKYIRADDNEGAYVVSTCTLGGVTWRRTVSIAQYGDEEAYRLACEIKEGKEREARLFEPGSLPW